MNITVQGTMSDAELNAMRYIFRDAFWGFIEARKGNYVERRYSEQTEEFKARKREEVAQRVAVARKLWAAALDVKVDMRVEAKLEDEWPQL
jgi:hypothetical protein